MYICTWITFQSSASISCHDVIIITHRSLTNEEPLFSARIIFQLKRFAIVMEVMNGLVLIPKGGKIFYLNAWSLILLVMSRLRLLGLLLFRYSLLKEIFIFFIIFIYVTAYIHVVRFHLESQRTGSLDLLMLRSP